MFELGVQLSQVAYMHCSKFHSAKGQAKRVLTEAKLRTAACAGLNFWVELTCVCLLKEYPACVCVCVTVQHTCSIHEQHTVDDIPSRFCFDIAVTDVVLCRSVKSYARVRQGHCSENCLIALLSWGSRGAFYSVCMLRPLHRESLNVI